ncbi:hypothetical protein GCM10022232_92270 [Streptomyces plumbiresistens]|uniref:Uncharacterized protein n=1 Tax=Streptomyces plumbiresistens TaxID=511811 RepID=A0ABP7TVL2_9ACTN
MGDEGTHAVAVEGVRTVEIRVELGVEVRHERGHVHGQRIAQSPLAARQLHRYDVDPVRQDVAQHGEDGRGTSRVGEAEQPWTGVGGRPYGEVGHEPACFVSLGRRDLESLLKHLPPPEGWGRVIVATVAKPALKAGPVRSLDDFTTPERLDTLSSLS